MKTYKVQEIAEIAGCNRKSVTRLIKKLYPNWKPREDVITDDIAMELVTKLPKKNMVDINETNVHSDETNVPSDETNVPNDETNVPSNGAINAHRSIEQLKLEYALQCKMLETEKVGLLKSIAENKRVITKSDMRTLINHLNNPFENLLDGDTPYKELVHIEHIDDTPEHDDSALKGVFWRKICEINEETGRTKPSILTGLFKSMGIYEDFTRKQSKGIPINHVDYLTQKGLFRDAFNSL